MTALKKLPKGIMVILAIFIIWRVLLLLISHQAFSQIGLDGIGFSKNVPTISFVKHTYRYDAGWYYSIAKEGYPQKISPSLVFYPLFPMLVGLGKYILLDPVVTAYLLNLIFGFLAFFYLYKLAELHFKDNAQAIRVVLLFAFFPTSYFLMTMYTEALFCALGFAGFYYAKKRKWLLACLLAGLLTAVRLPGLIFAMAIAVEYMDSIDFDLKKIGRESLLFMIAPAGIIAYGIFCLLRYGDALAMFHAYGLGEWPYQKFDWNIVATIWKQGLLVIDGYISKRNEWFVTGLNLFSWLVALILGTWGYMKKIIRPSYLFLIVSSLIIFSLNSNLHSVTRYILPLFPLYIIVVSMFRKLSEWAYSLLLLSSAAMMFFFLILFSNSIWTF